jgi:hypothetical protein
MGKYPALFLAVFTALLSACPNPNGGNGGGEKEEPPLGTSVYFVNDNAFSVIVYSDASRLVKFADVEANSESEPRETAPNPNGTVFYPRYNILIDEQVFPYDFDGFVVRIDADKQNEAPVPRLDEMDPAEPVTAGVYIKIQNLSSFPLTLKRGNSEVNPDGKNSPIVAKGETARYLVDGGPVSGYSFMRNTVTPVDFPAELPEKLASGHLYSFSYSGSPALLALVADKPLTIAQALEESDAGANSGADVSEEDGTIPPPPRKPEGLTAATGSGSVMLSWQKVPGATSYEIYRSTSSSSDMYLLGTVPGTVASYTDPDQLYSGNTYYYSVRAVNASGKSTYSEKVYVSPSPPQKPDGLEVVNAESGSVTLSWNSVAGATSYEIYRSTSSYAIDTVPGTVTSYTDNVPSSGSYYYRVKAGNAWGTGAYSEWSSSIYVSM